MTAEATEQCKRCKKPLEISRNAALSCLCARCYAKADGHLVLVRVAIPRWKVIQWWLCEKTRDARALIRKNAGATTPDGAITAALRTATARVVPMQRVRDRGVRCGYSRSGMNSGTIGNLAAEPWAGLSLGHRGEPRMIGYELTGSRARDGL